MAKPLSRYVCQSCGAVYPKWTGRCDACGTWNQVVEELSTGSRRQTDRQGRGLATVPLGCVAPDRPRRTTGMGEFDRVCGGGLVPGSAVLIGGDPGIGKSTLLLQVACRLSAEARCLYVSGEEAVEQIQMRAARLDLAGADLELATGTATGDIAATIGGKAAPALAVVDSVQTLAAEELESAPGTVAQVRASAAILIGAAKASGTTLVLVGHVTKDGTIAGPRVLEHMVDTVLSFEGERSHQFRILRANKNRFGPTDEIGVFRMSDGGLIEVTNPSSLFLSGRADDVTGACVFAGMEGTRPVLVEIQALVAPSALGTPRRAVVGWDSARLAMVLAVLEARCGIAIGNRDIYLNVAGGLRVGEPAADLAVAAALLSSLTGTPVPRDTVAFGEIGLSGEVRAVSRSDLRLREAAKLGFSAALMPPPPREERRPDLRPPLTLREIARVDDLLPLFGPADRSNEANY